MQDTQPLACHDATHVMMYTQSMLPMLFLCVVCTVMASSAVVTDSWILSGHHFGVPVYMF